MTDGFWEWMAVEKLGGKRGENDYYFLDENGNELKTSKPMTAMVFGYMLDYFSVLNSSVGVNSLMSVRGCTNMYQSLYQKLLIVESKTKMGKHSKTIPVDML